MLLGGLALLGEGRSAARRGHEMGISATTTAAGCNRDIFPVMREVGNLIEGLLGFGVELTHDRTHRHLQNQIFTAFSVATRSLAVCATFRTKMVLEAIVDQGRQLRRSLDHHVAATTAVATVRTTLGHVGFAPKGHATSAAISALDVDSADIGKLRHRMPFS